MNDKPVLYWNSYEIPPAFFIFQQKSRCNILHLDTSRFHTTESKFENPFAIWPHFPLNTIVYSAHIQTVLVKPTPYYRRFSLNNRNTASASTKEKFLLLNNISNHQQEMRISPCTFRKLENNSNYHAVCITRDTWAPTKITSWIEKSRKLHVRSRPASLV